MLRKRFSEPATAVKRTPFNDPWSLLGELESTRNASPWLDPSAEVRQHFYRLVARRRSPEERDHLLAKRLGVFGYRLADAIREVERHVLEHMVENN